MHFFLSLFVCLIWFGERIGKWFNRTGGWYSGSIVDTATTPHVPWNPLCCFVQPSSGICASQWLHLSFLQRPALGLWPTVRELEVSRRVSYCGQALGQDAGVWNTNSLPQVLRTKPLRRCPMGSGRSPPPDFAQITLAQFLSLLCPACLVPFLVHQSTFEHLRTQKS